MREMQKAPRILFKYRPFDDRTLGMLVNNQVYYADPRTFNDPLDVSPTLQIDISDQQLSNVLSTLIQRRMVAKMKESAKEIKYENSGISDHIEALCSHRTKQHLKDIDYFSEGLKPGCLSDPKPLLLSCDIIKELLRQYDKGICSLSSKSDCLLMWSHYADQHRGLCLGYSIPVPIMVQLHEVSYGGSRKVQASKIAAMLEGDLDASRDVDAVVLLRKAKDWEYENEWRLIGKRGPNDLDLELEEVVFGLRCPDFIRFAVVVALEKRSKPVSFFEMRDFQNTFKLERRALQIESLKGDFTRHGRFFDEFSEIAEN